MIMYTIIKSISKNENVTVNTHSIMESSMKLYMKFEKKGKTHRGFYLSLKETFLILRRLFQLEGMACQLRTTAIK